MEDEQLSRMETKIDKLSEAVVAMARMEERNITVSKRFDMSNNAWKKYEDRMSEKKKDQNISTSPKISVNHYYIGYKLMHLEMMVELDGQGLD